MGEWKRSTSEITLEQIRPEMAAAIQKHITANKLKAGLLDDSLICIETISEKKKTGLFSKGNKQMIHAAVVTPAWLVVVSRSEKANSAAALAALLKDINATDYATGPFYKAIPDTGLTVEGIFAGRVGINGSQRVSIFVPLGEEPAARKFKAILFEALEKAGG